MDNLIWSVIIIGGGISGYTAGIYTSRANLKTLILEGVNWGGQLMTTDIIENYPGFLDGISGPELMMNMRQQAEKYGSVILSEDVIKIDGYNVYTKNNIYHSKSIIISTGAIAKTIDYPAYDLDGNSLPSNTFWNHGISACAVCDGALPMFRDKPIIVVGGGDSACQEALFLANFGSEITILVRGEKMRASSIMQKRVNDHPKIKVRYLTSITGIYGSVDPKPKLNGVFIDDEKIETSGLFFAIGHSPNTGFLNGQLDLDDHGYILTNNTRTNVSGIFACGDVQDPIYRQAITAAGSGCQAALECEKFLAINSV